MPESLTEVCRGQRRSAGVHGGQPGSTEVSRGPRRSAGVHGGQPGSTEVSRGPRRSAGVNGGQPGSTEVNRGQRRSAGVNVGQPGPEEVNRSHPLVTKSAWRSASFVSSLLPFPVFTAGRAPEILTKFFCLFKFFRKIFPLHLCWKLEVIVAQGSSMGEKKTYFCILLEISVA